MDHLRKLKGQFRNHLLAVLLLNNAILIGMWWLGSEVLDTKNIVLLTALLVTGGLLALLLAIMSTGHLIEPVSLLWRAILHVSAKNSNTTPPDLAKVRLGRELVTSLALQVYQMASGAPQATQKLESKVDQSTVMNNIPLPLFVIGKDQTILFANEASATYLGVPYKEIEGKNFYTVLDLSFTSPNTYDAWLKDCRSNKITATTNWEHVKAHRPEHKVDLQFDMAAYYNRDNPEGIETMVVLFDHTTTYGNDDQAMSFVALAVHELRTPLTVLRGYIEVFEEELDGTLTPELASFMHKMNASAQQLTAFVSNILNVARVEDNQLILQLHEENWTEVVNGAIADISLRAQVHGKHLECTIAPNLPTVGVDRVSIYEVLNNLVDNAIKYSAKSEKIIINSYLKPDGMIETTVQDFGVGVPIGAMENLFEKFYRNHRNRTQVGGTGLGLYLSKAIVNAHGGQIWVQSKEGQGSTFGFTVQPYTKLADEQKNNDNKDIVRGAHGWIKNHSLYRR